MLHDKKKENPGCIVWVGYEASGFGFGLSDIFEDEGFRAVVLAPTHLPTSCKSRSNKTDRKDTERVLGVLRAHSLAGNELPEVWKPDKSLRDDREVVRRHQNIKTKLGDIKNEINGFLRLYGIRKPRTMKESWTKIHIAWVKSLVADLEQGAASKLNSLVREFEFYIAEAERMHEDLIDLSKADRYKPLVKALTRHKGVGLITAMVFLTELGDMSRFANRKAVGSYLGLAPRSYESGETDDRKGHISKMGPKRVRKVLNQAAWSAVTWDPQWKKWFDERTVGKKHLKRKFIVAVMRKLGIILWHDALRVSAAMS
jgi:transposase